MSVQEQLAAEFVNGEVLTFQGRGGMTFDYIEDETVMDRLDEVLGVGGWSVSVEAISVTEGIVKVSLQAIVDGKGVEFQDFGYATRTDGEALKEAVSDGIRRCGRFLGIGRYLYHKHTPRAAGGQGRTSSPTPLRPVARPGSGAAPPPTAPPAGIDEAICPEHDVEWRGEPGDLYHRLESGGYCRHPDNVKRPRR